MNGSENKTPLALMEQVIMVFVFALAAALCVQVFVYARAVSVSMEERDRGINICQSVAETAKLCSGELEEMEAYFDGYKKDDSFLLFYDEKWNVVKETDDNICYQVAFRVLEEGEFCSSGEVVALKKGDNAEIFSLQIAWQQ